MTVEIKNSPAYFIAHGSPMNAIANNAFTSKLSKVGENIKAKAIIVISAHWETDGTYITGMKDPRTIHDMYGFPEELYNVKYPASGDPDLAKKISEIIPEIEIDHNKWGLDHGSWSLLVHLKPKAEIPVLQISLNKSLTLSQHFEFAKKLLFLRKEGIAIIGSGNIVHNLREINWTTDATPHPWALEFSNWFKERILEKKFHEVINSPLSFKAGALSNPSLEHYIPSLYILALQDEQENIDVIYNEMQNASISMLSFKVG